jgi:hypothetical protein
MTSPQWLELAARDRSDGRGLRFYARVVSEFRWRFSLPIRYPIDISDIRYPSTGNEEDVLTGGNLISTMSRVGRKKINADEIMLRLPPGMLEQIDGARAEKEPRTDMIRDAIRRELKRRDDLKKRREAKRGGELG